MAKWATGPFMGGWRPTDADVERVAKALEREFDRVVDECNGDADFVAAAKVAIAAMEPPK